MLPVMAEKVLEVGPLGLGSILSLGGVGALISLVFISSFKDIDPNRLLLVLTLGLFSTCLVLFAFSPWFPLSLGLIALAYAFGMGYETIISALLLIVVQKRMRGRVLSFQTVAWGGFGIPGFFMGTIGGTFTASIAIATGGIVVLIYTLINLRTLLKADRSE
jgi:MFS family permease